MSRIKNSLKWLKKNSFIFNVYSAFKATKTVKKELNNSIPPAIIVYQMGKVGSTSVFLALKRANLRNPVFHVHFLSEDIMDHLKIHKQSGVKHNPFHLTLGKALRKALIKKNYPIKAISLVRDPIAWYISVLFEPPYFEKEILNNDNQIDPKLAIQYIENKLKSLSGLDYMNSWFNREVKRYLGIDIFETEFPKEKGYKNYSNGNKELLVILLENLSDTGANIISQYIGIDKDIQLKEEHARQDKPEAFIYKRVLSEIRLDRKTCEKVYSGFFSQHFYDNRTIESFIKRWTKEH